MLNFSYVKPNSVAEACAFLAQQGEKAKVLAGGTDLVVQIREKSRKLQNMAYVVDISGLSDLKGIREENGKVVLGALTTHAEVAASPLIRQVAPLLAHACSQVGGPQTRNMGTIGGNICNASLSADSVTAFVALDTVLTIAGPTGTRELPIAEVFVKSEQNALQPGEILTAVSFTALQKDTPNAFIKLGRRKALSIARMNVAVILEKAGEQVKEARIAVGAAFPTTRRVESAEALLAGKAPTKENISAAATEVARAMVETTGVRWSTEYKEPVVQVLVRRAIEQALGV